MLTFIEILDASISSGNIFVKSIRFIQLLFLNSDSKISVISQICKYLHLILSY